MKKNTQYQNNLDEFVNHMKNVEDSILEKAFSNIEKVSELRSMSAVKLDKIKDERFRDMLFGLYQSEGFISKLTASLFNSIVNSHSMSFMLSKNIVEKIAKKDPNYISDKVTMKQYKLMIAKITGEFHLIKRIVEPSRGKAGVMEVVNLDVIKLLLNSKSKGYYKKQKDFLVDRQTKTDNPEMEKIDSILDGIKVPTKKERELIKKEVALKKIQIQNKREGGNGKQIFNR